MKISVVKVWTDNELEQIWHTDENGQLVCSHEHIEHDPGEHGDWDELNFGSFDYCADCGQELDSEV